ncbi:tyrosine-type recombinase/integrase [Sulfuriroseicoccus oceanibius]|uniref:Tyrosine-type recombinase/integrase n=1 Tax=Sulfuriroseicoccus oceanibius TaxID=2707525 RepID=A0A6B3L7M9_9BACT|nr:tyrosine-type recombinase/integrase [Sulfuriroseicoccus oceanibius]QQL43739.1 tyrosine-type recombinase/integrase [Sulfuriroseicoccus oceanibius]
MRNEVIMRRISYRSYRWEVVYYEGGKRYRRRFVGKAGEDGAEAFRKQKQEELDDHGSKHDPITDEERRAVHSFREQAAAMEGTPTPPKLQDAVDLYFERAGIRKRSLTCSEIAESLKRRIAAEGRSEVHQSNVTYRLKAFTDKYGEWLACDVSREVIDDYLTHLGLAAQTVNNHRRILHQLFAHAIREGATSENPVTNAVKPKVVSNRTQILNPKQVAELMEKATDRLIPALAISYFAGVRRSEIERLDWADIDLEDQHIEIHAEKAKSAKRRIVPMSDNLKAWLIPHAQESGPVITSPAIHRNELQDLAAKISFKIPANAGRHCFASYHLAKHENADKLARALGHPDASLVYNTYSELVKPRAAATYWAITPPSHEKVTAIRNQSNAG